MVAAGGAPMVAGIFGLTGASVAGYKVAKRTAQVDDFSLEKISKGFLLYLKTLWSVGSCVKIQWHAHIEYTHYLHI